MGLALAPIGNSKGVVTTTLEPLDSKLEEPVTQKVVTNKILLNPSNSTSTPTSLVRNFVDSLIRSAGRQVEASVDFVSDSPFVRAPFRFVTEILRNGTSGSVVNLINDKKITKDVWYVAAKKALENTTATVVIEPNKFTSSFARMGAGFVNMAVRFGARVALVALDVISPNDINLEGVPDELLSRSVGRLIRPFSENPVLGMGTRLVEQMFINFGLEKLFVKNHVLPKVLKKGQKIA